MQGKKIILPLTPVNTQFNCWQMPLQLMFSCSRNPEVLYYIEIRACPDTSNYFYNLQTLTLIYCLYMYSTPLLVLWVGLRDVCSLYSRIMWVKRDLHTWTLIRKETFHMTIVFLFRQVKMALIFRNSTL